MKERGAKKSSGRGKKKKRKETPSGAQNRAMAQSIEVFAGDAKKLHFGVCVVVKGIFILERN